MIQKWREKLNEKGKRKNGYYNLSKELMAKLDYFNNDDSSNKLCKYFTWDEFYEIFSKTTYVYQFLYKRVEYIIGCDFKYRQRFTWTSKDRIWFCESHTKTSDIKQFKSPQELLENARIDGKSIKEIWNDIELE